MFPVPAGGAEDNDEQQQAAHHEREHVLRDRDVERTLPAVRLDDLSLFRIDLQALVHGPVLQELRREDVPARRAVDDHGKMEDKVPVPP